MRLYLKISLLVFLLFFIGCSQKSKPLDRYDQPLEPVKVKKGDQEDMNQFFKRLLEGVNTKIVDTECTKQRDSLFDKIFSEKELLKPIGRAENKQVKKELKEPHSSKPSDGKSEQLKNKNTTKQGK